VATETNDAVTTGSMPVDREKNTAIRGELSILLRDPGP
jgi:hypothetical protein